MNNGSHRGSQICDYHAGGMLSNGGGAKYTEVQKRGLGLELRLMVWVGPQGFSSRLDDSGQPGQRGRRKKGGSSWRKCFREEEICRMSFFLPMWQDEIYSSGTIYPIIPSSAGSFWRIQSYFSFLYMHTGTSACMCAHTQAHTALWSLLQLSGCLTQGRCGLTFHISISASGVAASAASD